MSAVQIGTSGWVYPHWRGRFYPREVPQGRWLEFYAGRFSTVEVNNSFYRLPSAEVFKAWREGPLPGSVRAVMEFRDPSWHVPEVFDLLERRGSAYCIMVAPKLLCRPIVTAGTLYVRFHSPGGVWPVFSRRRLHRWADLIRGLMRNADQGWVYFNNDAQGAAIDDAVLLRELL